MRRTLLSMALTTAASSSVLADGHSARACGGCFHPPTEVTVVNEHRMVFSIGKTQTVLWDQIKYGGDPKEFAWVLPVRPGTKLELSHDDFMVALDEYTQPVITGPTPPPSKGSAFGCGSSSSTTLDSVPNSGVTVVSEQVVGPYEVATLRAIDSGALEAWLKAHSYVIPPAVQPTVDSYVKEKFDFIALRLLPNKGIGAMQPVRVVTQGADATLPLRMVAAGVGQRVGILLYVIGEGRYRTTNFHDVTVKDSQLVWDTAASKSNYSTLAESAMTGGDGKGVLTEFAGHANTSDFGQAGSRGFFLPSLKEAYNQTTRQSFANNNCSRSPLADSGFNTPDVNVPDASVDGSPSDASVADANAPDAAPPASNNDCVFDDVDVATKGMNPSDVWITRMRMHLPVSALAADLQLGAESTQSLVSNQHSVASTTDAGGGCSEGGGSNTWTGVALGALGAILVARRRKRVTE